MSEQSNLKLNLRLDYRFVAIALLVVIAAMLAFWRPWSAAAGTSDRTVDVTGTTTISARPDEFVFYPTYEFKNDDKQTALNAMSAKSDELVTAIKKLGVADKDIKTNSDSWSYPSIPVEGDTSASTYTLRLTVTIDDEKTAQKVLDYLVTTSPSGTISPQPTFSEKKLKEIEDQARIEASKDARAKAEQSAKNLGFGLGSVKTVNDGTGFGGGVYPLYEKDLATSTMDSARSSLTIQPGENELTYSVAVTYFIR